jgi:uncharacterized membrane protein YjdF
MEKTNKRRRVGMIRKKVEFNWCTLNTAIIVLLAVFFIVYTKWPKQEEHYWFVSYEWVKLKERGAGRTCIEIKEDDFNIVVAENTIKNENKFDALIINNFIPINKKSCALCIK